MNKVRKTEFSDFSEKNNFRNFLKEFAMYRHSCQERSNHQV